tara:strand:- start:967 stop:1086 length:120 start_codon:yes stop_codon:yes gene_type:complete
MITINGQLFIQENFNFKNTIMEVKALKSPEKYLTHFHIS